MIIKKGDREIETKTLPGTKRPSLLILRDRNLHSKVGMMMDDERAAEFMDYLADMLCTLTCPVCGGRIIWKSDFSFDDCGYEGDGIVSFYECMNCGADVEVRCGTDSMDG